MLFVTTATNDDDLARVLGSSVIRASVPSDVCFWGCGDDDVLSVAVERKKIGDLCQCINDGRLLHQAQTAHAEGIAVYCLVAEGSIRANPDDGLLDLSVWGVNRSGKRAEVWQPVRPTTTYSRFDQFLTELDWLVGVVVKRSRDVYETPAIVRALYANFQTPPDHHQSLHKMFEPPQGTVELVRPGLVRRVAKELPGIGWERSRAVAGRFGSVQEMVGAGIVDWEQVPGIGRKTAEKVVAALRGGSGGMALGQQSFNN